MIILTRLSIRAVNSAARLRIGQEHRSEHAEKSTSRRDRPREDIMSAVALSTMSPGVVSPWRGWSRRHQDAQGGAGQKPDCSGTALQSPSKAARLADEAAHGPRAVGGDATFIEGLCQDLAAAVWTALAEALRGEH